MTHVRLGSKADICAAKSHVRFTPESGHVRCTSACPLWANSGHTEARSQSACRISCTKNHRTLPGVLFGSEAPSKRRIKLVDLFFFAVRLTVVRPRLHRCGTSRICHQSSSRLCMRQNYMLSTLRPYCRNGL